MQDIRLPLRSGTMDDISQGEVHTNTLTQALTFTPFGLKQNLTFYFYFVIPGELPDRWLQQPEDVQQCSSQRGSHRDRLQQPVWRPEGSWSTSHHKDYKQKEPFNAKIWHLNWSYIYTINCISYWLPIGCTVRRRDQGGDEHTAAASERATEYPTEDQCTQHEGHGEARECQGQVPRDQWRWDGVIMVEAGQKLSDRFTVPF